MHRGPMGPCDNQRPEQQRRIIEVESNNGLNLIMGDTPICSFHLDETVPCITVTWKGYATSTHFRYVHELIIDLLQQHTVSRVLDDATLLPTIGAADQRWLIGTWMPRAAEAGLRATASKRPVAYFGRLAVETIRRERSNGIQMRCFDALEPARLWLKELKFD